MTKLVTIAFALSFAAVGCSKDDDPKKYAAKQDKEASKGETATTVKHTAPVPGRKKILCKDLFDPEKLKEEMGEELVVSDRKEPNFTAGCTWKKAGETPSEAEQEKLKKEKGYIPVLPGDELCRVRVNCWLPAQSDERTKALCKRRGEQGNMKLGVYACVQIEQRGAHDGYIYRFVDADTKCAIKVTSQPLENNEEATNKCATAAMKLITKETISKVQD